MQILSANLLHTQRSASSDNRFRQVPAVNLERKAKEHRHRLVDKFRSTKRYPPGIPSSSILCLDLSKHRFTQSTINLISVFN
ncbi:hypothetical protein PUN28_017560 [Cardiocondyla obscurior]|uniref:Uncharacterized protein n=1 Tax=Cardiocondyla obscurior TaxID=286306 RepID=A0AAW2EK75_9HYME